MGKGNPELEQGGDIGARITDVVGLGRSRGREHFPTLKFPTVTLRPLLEDSVLQKNTWKSM